MNLVTPSSPKSYLNRSWSNKTIIFFFRKKATQSTVCKEIHIKIYFWKHILDSDQEYQRLSILKHCKVLTSSGETVSKRMCYWSFSEGNKQLVLTPFFRKTESWLPNLQEWKAVSIQPSEPFPWVAFGMAVRSYSCVCLLRDTHQSVLWSDSCKFLNQKDDFNIYIIPKRVSSLFL